MEIKNASFVDQIQLELQRAERYSVFMSIILLDLSFLRQHFGPNSSGVVQRIYDLLKSNVRVVDYIAIIDNVKIGFLFPETSRQGAEIAMRRLNEMIRDALADQNGSLSGKIIPMEIASFPDAAGTRTIREFLEEYTEVARN